MCEIADGSIPGNIAEVIKDKRIMQGKPITYSYCKDKENREPYPLQVTSMDAGCRDLFIYRLLH